MSFHPVLLRPVMRFSPSFSLLVGLLLGQASVNAFSFSSNFFKDGDVCDAEICVEPELMNPRAVQYSALHRIKPTPTRTRRLTNALRLALGLPLNPPKPRRADGSAPQPSVSPTPQVTYEGIIGVTNLTDGSSLGYITYLQRASGVFKHRPEIQYALNVTFSLDVGATSGVGINLEMTNAYGPLLGLVQGRENDGSDMGPDTLNYVYFNGIDLPGSPPGSIPEEIPNTYTLRTGLPRTAESSVWNVDLITGSLSVDWTNSDGRFAQIQTWSQYDFLYAGGNPELFIEKFSRYPLTFFSLHFIPLPT